VNKNHPDDNSSGKNRFRRPRNRDGLDSRTSLNRPPGMKWVAGLGHLQTITEERNNVAVIKPRQCLDLTEEELPLNTTESRKAFHCNLNSIHAILTNLDWTSRILADHSNHANYCKPRIHSEIAFAFRNSNWTQIDVETSAQLILGKMT
jgi:hypothetical protein